MKTTKLLKRAFVAVAALAATLVLPGCLQNETVIHLNKDGSGTLVEETTFGPQVLDMIAQMAALGGGGDPLADLVSEEKAKARAATLGDGVTLEKVEAVDAGGKKGGRVTYRFADINTLKISPDSAVKNAMPEMPMAPPGGVEKAAPITFSYADGKLTMKMPEPEKVEVPAGEAPAEGEEESMGEQEVMIMKQMMGDMKISFAIVIEPGIAETNASHVEGNRITLMEMEMGKLMEDAESLKKLTRLNKQDPDAALREMKEVKGVKMENQREVTVVVE